MSDQEDKALIPASSKMLMVERAGNGWIVWDREGMHAGMAGRPLAVAETPLKLADLLVVWAEAQERGE